MLTVETRQQDFPTLDDRVYLNTAAEGIMPQQVVTALQQYIDDKLLGMDGRLLHDKHWQSAKQQIANSFGLTPEEVGICGSSSDAYNLAALALQLREGDEVIINDLDFPSGATPWLQPTCPATVKVWRNRDGALRVEDLLPLLSANTRLVTVSLVSFYNGYKIPLPSVVEVIQKNSQALLALDVTQALGRIPLDLSGVDLVISSSYKWILACHGGGLIGVPKAAEERWTAHAGGWFNLANAFEEDRFQQVVTKPGAASFTVGMPNYPAVYAIEAGLKYVQDVGIENIDKHCQPLMEHLLAELQQLSIQLLTPPSLEYVAGIIAWQHPEADRICEALHRQNIHIMSHAGRLRIAVHGYNTEADIEKFLSELRKAQAA